MTNQIPTPGQHIIIDKAGLQQTFLMPYLASAYTLVGPTMREEAIVYDEIVPIRRVA